MTPALMLWVASATAATLPSWAVEKIRSVELELGTPVFVATSGPDADVLAIEVERALGHPVPVLHATDPLAALEQHLLQDPASCGFLLGYDPDHSFTLQRKGDCETPPTVATEVIAPAPPVHAPPPVDAVEDAESPTPPETPIAEVDLDKPGARAGIIVHIAELRAGGNGTSWGAGSSVDIRFAPKMSIGGGALFVTNGYAGTDLRLSACAYAKSFERGLYGRVDLGTSAAISRDSASASGSIGLGPGWRLPYGGAGALGYYGVVDIGFQFRVEAGYGGAPFEGAALGSSFSVSGGIGL